MTNRRANELVGRIIGRRFEVVAPIGRGRNTLMLAAKDLEAPAGPASTGGEPPMVALKLLPMALAGDESFVRRFRHEVRSAASIDHPNVARVHAWGDEGQLFVVSEFIPGGSVRALMNSGQRLSPPQAAVVAVDVARGLDHLHRRGLVHRTIRPSNILLRTDGRAVISDVGIGWLLEEHQGDEMLDYRYMAPEMAGGDEHSAAVDGKLDVYALALSLMEAVDGRIPLLGADIGTTMTYRGDNEVPMSRRWGAVGKPVAKAARRNPAERSSAGDLEIALMAVADQFVDVGAITPVGVFKVSGAEPPLSSLKPTFGPSVAAEQTALGDASGSADTAPTATPAALTETGAEDEPTPVVRRRRAKVEADDEPKVAAPAEDADDGDGPQTPRNWMTAVAAILVIGAIAAVLRLVVFAPSGEVPVLVGKDLQVAKLEAKENEWKLDAETLIRKDGTEVDEVVSQSPDPGVQLEPGQTLRITVSLGPELAPFPLVLGSSLADATKVLEEAGFKVGKTTRQFDEAIAKDAVILADAEVDSAGLLPKETKVGLVVSDGPAPRKVPGALVGATEDEVVAQIVSVQLKATIEKKSSDKVEAGRVISVSPAEGKEVARDSTVKVVVSSGKPPVAVPFLGGQPLILAQDALTKAGFKVGTVTGPPTGVVAGTVPAAAAMVAPGSTINIVMQ